MRASLKLAFLRLTLVKRTTSRVGDILNMRWITNVHRKTVKLYVVAAQIGSRS
jgi:hypothetical protein